jgi:predicted enzyme related to lactoylglutathione lyase
VAHAVVHFEISASDAGRLADFYAALFGWRMQPIPGAGYTLVDTAAAGRGINGGIRQSADAEGGVKFYIETDDMQAALDKINLLGGKTETPITELAGFVTYAVFSDLDGLLIGLVLAPANPDQVMAPGPGAGGPVDWFEVLGRDVDRSRRFYAEIFGWQASQAGPGYVMIDTGTSRGIRGGMGSVADQGCWATVYASVPDVEAVLTRAVELGGAREYGPNLVDDHMQTGALRDPAGNVFGVYHHAPH